MQIMLQVNAWWCTWPKYLQLLHMLCTYMYQSRCCNGHISSQCLSYMYYNRTALDCSSSMPFLLVRGLCYPRRSRPMLLWRCWHPFVFIHWFPLWPPLHDCLSLWGFSSHSLPLYRCMPQKGVDIILLFLLGVPRASLCPIAPMLGFLGIHTCFLPLCPSMSLFGTHTWFALRLWWTTSCSFLPRVDDPSYFTSRALFKVGGDDFAKSSKYFWTLSSNGSCVTGFHFAFIGGAVFSFGVTPSALPSLLRGTHSWIWGMTYVQLSFDLSMLTDLVWQGLWNVIVLLAQSWISLDSCIHGQPSIILLGLCPCSIFIYSKHDIKFHSLNP